MPFVDMSCPYCGEMITLFVDESAGQQQYIEDCQVCCRPITVDVSFGEDNEPTVRVASENE